ncbi:hypothetical protein [Phenylobacterium sp.]|jgi:hypothetical protein|uniref:hypothetical protein n=1 Tax=Phenylobacterium sp. TaxID=1871053 RepID=UPI002F3F6151
MRPFLGAIAAAMLAASASAQTPPVPVPAPGPRPAPAPPAEPAYAYPVESHFGLFATAAGKSAFKETDAVPNTPGQQYGWFVKLNTNQPTVHVREEIELPAPATTWNNNGPLPPGMTVAADRRSAVFERDIPVRSGLILNIWTVAAGDPLGDYVIKVTFAGQLRQFNFAIH